jgi:hypothetical protein
MFNYTGDELEIKGTGTLYGTILAPNAHVYDTIHSNIHCSGTIICKSFLGGTEVGGISYDKPEDDTDSSEEDSSVVDESSYIDESSYSDNSSNEDSSLINDSSDIDSSEIDSSSVDSSSVDSSSVDSSSVDSSSVIDSSNFDSSSISSIPDSSSTPSSHSNPDISPNTGDGLKGTPMGNFLLAFCLLIIITIVSLISTFLSNKNHKDDND